MRVPVIAANWKMHKTIGEARAFAETFRREVGATARCEIVVAGPFTALAALRDAFAGTPIAVAGQNAHPEPQGAFTGEVSVSMLVDAGCRWVILGHSERRALFGESDAFVARKLAAALAARLRPIVCVGESLAEREAGRTFEVLGGQLEGSLAGVTPGQAAGLVIAYEPVWAIGTGRTATPEIAQEAHAFVRAQLTRRFGADAAAAIRIQYGGSVKPDNSAALLAQPDIDGALVGGASLDPASFWAIIRNGLSGETTR
jgi:triosephosphate isomerase